MINTNFWQQFYIKYIAYGEYQNFTSDLPTTFGVFSKEHFISTFLGILFIILFCYKTKDFSSKRLLKHQKIISIIMLVLEIFRMIWLRIYRPYLYILRFDYCNQVCLFLPICVLLNLKQLFPFLACVSFLGGGGVLVYPLHVFSDYGGFHIMSIQSMISHTLMVLSAINIARMFIVDLKKNFILSTFCFALMCVIAYVASIIRDINYLAMLSPEGLPFIKNIKAPFHIIFVVGIIDFGLFCCLFLISKIETKILCPDLKEKYLEENKKEVLINEI